MAGAGKRSAGIGALALSTALLIGGAWLFWSKANDQSAAERAYESAAPAAASTPELSRDGARGRVAFNAACAACHGRDAAGGPGGPPLIHRIYEPSHHGDESIRRAVRNGVKAHHWNFGDMPPQPDMSPETVETVISFLRETQAANGIR
ncbi:cytochrome c [Pikeienuella piscinae]|uniref:Cytochrome c n=1 Tax=Pikeienuella piscinae TaxID=2748098 RepID=A0A7L5BUX6_9RHOB|nr:cytochrome c [Pikeienuella piscinae]QIE54853.1 cytochrome c [Pikeienuella piscinae]